MMSLCLAWQTDASTDADALDMFNAAMAAALVTMSAFAQTAPQPPTSLPSQIWTWEQVKNRFELNNTTLLAGKLNIDELKAQEITAHLRPNPRISPIRADGTQIAPATAYGRRSPEHSSRRV